MAVRKNRPDDAPQDFSFLSGVADSPTVSNEAIADPQPLSVPDAPDPAAFQSLMAADVAVVAAASHLFPVELFQDQTAPVETTPVASVPVASVPVESAAVKTRPVAAAPSEEIPVEPVPAEETLEKETPAEEVPVNEFPAGETPAEETLSAESPAEETRGGTPAANDLPSVETPVESSPVETTRAESVFDDSTSADSVLDDSMSDESVMSEPRPSETAPVAAAPAEASSAIGAGPAPEPAAPQSVAQRTPVNPAPGKKEKAGLVPAALAEKLPAVVMGYAVALTLLFLYLVFTGRLSQSSNPALESLPDIRPLPANEFRKVPDGTALPEGHVMKLGESRRFGDVVVTPVRVTREPLRFQHFLSGNADESLTTAPVLKLWLQIENVADDYGFPPFDAGLMSHRSPPHATDETAAVNSFLTVAVPSDGKPFTRVLNYLQTMDSNFVLTGQESAKVVMPGETLTTFIGCSDDIGSVKATAETEYTWRIQFRKGVNQNSGNGVTTLIDVTFHGSDISENTAALTTPGFPVAG